MRPRSTRTLLIAPDADWRRNPAVARATLALLAHAVVAGEESGTMIEVETWSGEKKGIDDALAAGAAVHRVPITWADLEALAQRRTA
jgi:hypothetical protein